MFRTWPSHSSLHQLWVVFISSCISCYKLFVIHSQVTVLADTVAVPRPDPIWDFVDWYWTSEPMYFIEVMSQFVLEKVTTNELVEPASTTSIWRMSRQVLIRKEWRCGEHTACSRRGKRNSRYLPNAKADCRPNRRWKSHIDRAWIQVSSVGQRANWVQLQFTWWEHSSPL